VPVALAILGFQLGHVTKASADADISPVSARGGAHSVIYDTAFEYAANFYPLWFTYFQRKYATENRLLTYNSDGSVSIYVARKKPSGVPQANWLTVPKAAFDVMLRLYGLQGDVESYLPPAIRKR
jgi:hypothetical protein